MTLKIIAAIVLGLALLGCGSFGTLFAFWAALEDEQDTKATFMEIAHFLWWISIGCIAILVGLVVV